jgi:beta-N-acetylhexosaminidase
VRHIVGDTANAAVARRIAERAVVLVKDSLRAVPLRAPRGRVLSVTYARRSDLGAGVAFNAEVRRQFATLRQEYVSADDPEPNYSRILAAADSADVTIVGSYVNITSESATAGAPRAFIDFVRALQARGARPVIVTLGTPYLLQQVPDVPAYMIAWGPAPVSQQAAARALLGSIPITARLPIRIPPVAAIGAGERREASSTPRTSGAP